MGIQRVLIALGVVAAALFVGGCGRDDCGYVCYRWDDCFTLKGGPEACADECAAKARNDSSYRNSVEACAECAETRACTEATADCGEDCLTAILR